MTDGEIVCELLSKRHNVVRIGFQSLAQVEQGVTSSMLQPSRRKLEQLPLFGTSERSAQSAARSAGGILYQIRYATLRALHMEPGQQLGIEYLDDVSLIDPDYRAWRMQIKNETTPLGNMNPGLWKTLAYWSKLVASSSASNFHLLFITTAPIHGDFPLMLQRQETTAKERREYVENNIKKSDSEKVQKWIEEVKSLPAPHLITLLGRVQVIQEDNADVLLDRIKSALRQRTFRDESIDSVAERLEGWVLQRAHEQFQDGKGVRLREDDVRATLQNLRDKEVRGRPSIRHRLTPVNPAEARATYQNRMFYRQLEAIRWPGQGLDTALVDYLRNRKERADWQKHLEVTPDEIANYEDALLDAWKNEFMDPAGRRTSGDEALNGRELCDTVMKASSPPLCDNVYPPRHVFRGTYHELADERRLGWHPRWQSMFSAEEDKGPGESG